MSTFNDIDWKRKRNSRKVKNYAKRFSRFFGFGDEKKRYGFLCTPEGKWDSTATHMVERLKETNHPAFKSISALSRGIFLKRTNNRDTLHFDADASNTELLFRTIHSANQFSIYGAVSSRCAEFGLRPNEREMTSE